MCEKVFERRDFIDGYWFFSEREDLLRKKKIRRKMGVRKGSVWVECGAKMRVKERLNVREYRWNIGGKTSNLIYDIELSAIENTAQVVLFKSLKYPLNFLKKEVSNH